VALGKRHEVLAGGAEGDGDALFLLEVEAADAELRIQLGDHAGAAAGHEEVFAFVVLQPRLDLVGALDGVRGRVVEAGELEGTGEAAVRRIRAAQRLLDRLAKLRGMLGKAAELFQNGEALRPELALEEGVGEKADEGVGERALLRFAQRFGDAEEGVGVARIAVELVHPQRFEIVEFLLFNQRVCIVGKPQRETLREMERALYAMIAADAPPDAGGRFRRVRGGAGDVRAPWYLVPLRGR